MRVTTEELRRATLLLLKHLDEIGQKEFEIDDDFYWNVPETERYDSYTKPEEMTVGQLLDDWSEIESILSGAKSPMGYALVWLSSILRRVGETSVG